MNIIEPDHEGTNLRIGIVQARFSNEIGSAMLKVCTDKLISLGVHTDNITVATVPGALEVPLILQEMAQSMQYDALIAIGAVIRGETYHFELVANESGAAITRVGLDYHMPIANAILTTENDEQAHARIEEKATDAAVVAVECANLLNRLWSEQAIDDFEEFEEDE
ncbi:MULTISPECIES: 6,7-dimethyl-8-ribityllumazine synthase [Neisseria]|uniref:6,7-dimethyl-8-ribityllumazine synthase n=1 Tax=Neisseria dumasiana TaxID=1931275 RepID=A0A1X3DI95_9NEIS|nr:MULTISPECIES: 6,7-dimethyl-8-ribityllumazine synthase [Neisseria]KPN74214.1 6,7-dimethyl-8-ribityllumazine synthase [Neisseria sp. 74A18]OSI14858.1 6,7-dimethyl-8-ribityllumazine synthase [Neisseria dumasiana]OSI20879.1 6,7-dimethyl-8-ribityllumazine synthase [Neisseria dumasiana]OSI29235.1 6,7-dimethyl-8-ribityllumazine synthase [Neisseria dumasiana]UOO85151.1 6,7-dimethyl-8-ribityllumazine synthase [Neisseria dumasiana]